MRAVRYHEIGGAEVLRYEEVEKPLPRAGEVRVRVAASAYNAADGGIRSGLIPIPVQLPHVPGYDISGTVDAVAKDVHDLAVGDEVIGFLPMDRDGGAAEYVIAPADALVAAPSRISLADAAALPSVGLTAWQALIDDGGLRPSQRLLIIGAGGVVGKYAIQLAKRAGAYVIATASPRSMAAVRAAGADEVIDRTATEVLDAIDGQVDILLNLAPITPEQFADYVTAVRDGGVVVSTTAFMPTPGDDTRGVRAVTVFVLPNRERLRELVALVDDGRLTVEVTRRIPLTDLRALHAEAALGRIPGKVVVLPA